MTFQSTEDFIDKLNYLFNGLIALPLLLIAFGYLEIYSGDFKGFVILNSWYSSLVFVFVIVGLMIYLSRLFKSEIKKIDASLAIIDRVIFYYNIAKKFYLRVFFLSLLTTGLLFLFGEKSYAGAYAFILFMLSVNRPNLGSIASQLGLKGDARQSFINKSLF